MEGRDYPETSPKKVTMPAPKNNQNARKDDTASSFLYCRVRPEHKRHWVRFAKKKGGLSAWTIATLNKESGYKV